MNRFFFFTLISLIAHLNTSHLYGQMHPTLIPDIEIINLRVYQDIVLEDDELPSLGDDIYDITAPVWKLDEEPKFPGGLEDMYKWISDNMHCTEYEFYKFSREEVFVRFIVETDGTITNIRVLKSGGCNADKEALRLIKAMPEWKPALQNGNPVRCSYILPILIPLKDYWLPYIKEDVASDSRSEEVNVNRSDDIQNVFRYIPIPEVPEEPESLSSVVAKADEAASQGRTQDALRLYIEALHISPWQPYIVSSIDELIELGDFDKMEIYETEALIMLHYADRSLLPTSKRLMSNILYITDYLVKQEPENGRYLKWYLYANFYNKNYTRVHETASDIYALDRRITNEILEDATMFDAASYIIEKDYVNAVNLINANMKYIFPCNQYIFLYLLSEAYYELRLPQQLAETLWRMQELNYDNYMIDMKELQQTDSAAYIYYIRALQLFPESKPVNDKSQDCGILD